MPGKSIGFVINCDVSALILVCGEQQLCWCDNGCAEISTVQTGQLSRCPVVVQVMNTSYIYPEYIHTYIHKLYLSSDFSVAYIASISDPN